MSFQSKSSKFRMGPSNFQKFDRFPEIRIFEKFLFNSPEKLLYFPENVFPLLINA